MKEQRFEGLLVRFATRERETVFVIEPDDDSFLGEVTGSVQEIAVNSLVIDDALQTELTKSIGESIWIELRQAGDQTAVKLAGDWIPEANLPCSAFTVTQRDYDRDDLKEKCRVVAEALQAFQRNAAEASRKEFLLRARLEKYIVSRRQRWCAKLDFFQKHNTAKAEQYTQRLTLLDEVECLLNENREQDHENI